jgi:hypothetical protein
MKSEAYQLPETHLQVLDSAPEPQRVQVTLLDQDNLPVARGTAVLPILLGVGIFWPNCPMPPANRLDSVKCFTLPTGETMNIKELTLCPGTPPRYEFWVNPL